MYTHFFLLVRAMSVYNEYMVTRHKRGKITWVDMESPTHAELDSVMKEFSIDGRVQDEIVSPTHYPLVISYPKYEYLILHFPTADPSTGTRNQEIDFIVGKNFLITARYEVIDTIHSLHRVFEAEDMLGLSRPGAHTGHLLERIMKRLYGAIREEMERASRLLEHIENDMFSGKEQKTVRSISDIGRVLLRFETAISRQRDPLTTFLKRLTTPSFFGTQFTAHVAHIEGERSHVANLVTSYREAATELRATNDSLLSASQNEIMKTLTFLAFLASPLTLVAALFGMNTENTPLNSNPHGFWIIIAIGVMSSLGMYLYFRLKKWI